MDYQAEYHLYEESKVFDTSYVDLYLTENDGAEPIAYVLNEIKFELSRNLDKNCDTYVSKVVDSLKNAVLKMNISNKLTDSHPSWSVFYALKELVDIISKCDSQEEYRHFFRGQGGNWELKPTLFRDGENGYADKFRTNFEEIYKSIARRFPERISYYPIDEPEKRTANLAEIQHYGLGTPLVDITENPYIAMLFMVDGYKCLKLENEPQLDIFFCRHDGNNLLFQEVDRETQNPRIVAQRGAFLNFDRLTDTLLSGGRRIPRICIRIKYQQPELLAEEVEDLPDAELNSADEIQKNRKIALESAIDDIRGKLKSYFYTSEDLFPDFYMYLGYLKHTYIANPDSNSTPTKYEP